MNKVIKTILISSIAVFGLGILSVSSTSAQVDELVVEFQTTPLPLFNEANFLPGQSVTRWVKVTNNSTKSQSIATQAISVSNPTINVNSPARLGDVLQLEIKEGGSRLYKDALSKFFSAGEVYLSDLAGSGTQTQYDFIVTFYSGAGNPFQGKTLQFDILVGFQGTEGGLLPGAGTGAGGFLPPGLTIQDESVIVATTTETSVTITWTTSYLSTSQVIYSRWDEPHTLDLTKPNYGYAHATPEDLTKVTSHSVTIAGLTSGTTYYFRAVSHASLAISREYTFTTKGIIAGAVEEIVPEKPEVGVSPTEEEIGIPLAEIEKEGVEEPLPPEELVVEEEEMPKRDLASMLLASLSHSWEGFLGGKFSNNLIFWALIASLGIFLSGLSLIKKPRMIFSLLGFLGIWSVLISSFFLPLPIVEQLRMPLPNFIVLPIGVLFFLVGVLVIYLAFRHLSFRGASNLEKPKELITSGVYGVIRHPLYFGLLLAYLGWCLIFKAPLALLFTPIIFFLFLILISLEEKDLLKIYGQSYREYQKRAPWRIILKII